MKCFEKEIWIDVQRYNIDDIGGSRYKKLVTFEKVDVCK